LTRKSKRNFDHGLDILWVELQLLFGFTKLVIMFRNLCFKIAFDPKDELARKRADVIIEDDDLSRILPYLV
jgi:hypothetical protein